MDYITEGWAEMSVTLVALSEGTDPDLDGTTYQEVVANVAEYRASLGCAALLPGQGEQQRGPDPAPPPLIRSVWRPSNGCTGG